MRDNDGWEDWTYWAQVAQETLAKPQKQGDWLAWLRFRQRLLPFD